jgi:hypothetical protein
MCEMADVMGMRWVDRCCSSEEALMAKAEKTNWPDRSRKKEGNGRRPIGERSTWPLTCESPVPTSELLFSIRDDTSSYLKEVTDVDTNLFLSSGRVYLEWARLVAPVRRSMDFVYDESMEVELHDE